ncbi:MAG: hypothetical protein K5872_22275 [Rhizobiaceae bacterium]|nr:hypothetical protein [Rhizobiaceae bacterium]MCV0408948.1 hypothetical protein [Rhizobiaceae bacterium]
MNFLALCQRVASDSGTVSGELPSTVAGQTGRLGKIVRWTNDAWRSIQLAHSQWLWMRSDFSGQTVAGTRTYTGVDMGVASRFGDFLCRNDARENRYSIYLTATGVADEGQLQYRDYDHFYTVFQRGVQTQNPPSYFTITPDGKLALHPIPDDAYTVKGPYRKDVQDLTADGDIPEMPTRFHDLIVDIALQNYLDVHDEATVMVPLHRLRTIPRFAELERDQLPTIRLPGPLA